MILQWRNNDNIRKWMFNSDEISFENHLSFIENLKESTMKSYWMVRYKGDPVGCVYFDNIKFDDESGEIGLFYRPDRQNHSPFGIDFVFQLYRFAFNVLGFKVLKGNIRQDNVDSLALAIFLGARKKTESYVKAQNYVEIEVEKGVFKSLTEERFSCRNYLKYIKYNFLRNNN